MFDNEPRHIKRCAIYTRQSVTQSADGQANSLETQREICAAYVMSQRHRGWVEAPQRYDDPGQSGSGIERSALTAMMQDIEAGRVDVIVTYKVDRLTRSLNDFVRMLEVLDRYSVSFVSITQSFDTSDSMGRMILNMLLTFSQFERELIAERIRDGIRNRKRHGKWQGGYPPFGYQWNRQNLTIVEEEAEIVRLIYFEFLRERTFTGATRAVQRAGLCTSVKFTLRGTRRGGRPISAGSIYGILHNPVYVGDIRGHDGTYRGIHEPIISRDTWEAAQTLANARHRRPPDSKQTNHFLAGLLSDDVGRNMLLSVERYKGSSYYTYASSNTLWSQREYCRAYRANADRLDQLVLASVRDFLGDRQKLRAALKDLGLRGSELDKLVVRGPRAAELLAEIPAEALEDLFSALVTGIEVGPERIAISFRAIELRRFLLWDGLTRFFGRPADWPLSDAKHVLHLAVNVLSGKRAPFLYLPDRDPAESHEPNAALLRLLQNARNARELIESHRELSVEQLARKLDCRPAHVSRLVRLNYLAPDIVASILDGTQPPTLTRDVLYKADLPLDWSLQRRLFGFPMPQRLLPPSPQIFGQKIKTVIR